MQLSKWEVYNSIDNFTFVVFAATHEDAVKVAEESGQGKAWTADGMDWYVNTAPKG